MEDCRRLIRVNVIAVHKLGITEDMRVYKRIAHVLNVVLRIKPMPDTALQAISGILDSLSYKPPWDDENSTQVTLTQLTIFCEIHFADNATIEQAFHEDLSAKTLETELQQWLLV